MTHDRFIVGSHAQIETHESLTQKMLGPFGILYIGTPQASNYPLSPVKYALREAKPPPGTQITAQYHTLEASLNVTFVHVVFYLAFCLDMAPGRMNRVHSETRTHS